MWGRGIDELRQMQKTRSNERYLPGISFPELLQPETELDEVLSQPGDVLMAVPSEGFRPTLEMIKSRLSVNARIVWATKGLDPQSNKLLHEVVEDVLGLDRAYAVISGPTFAKEVAESLPTAVTLAANDETLAEDLANSLHNDFFRVYTSRDIIGVEVGGAVKNVMAIAAGIADGLGFGANTRAALITRGLAEIMRLGVAIGGDQETFMGLAGLGDLVLTSTDNLSRNRRLGLALARGQNLADAINGIGQAVEGAQTVKQVLWIAAKNSIDMPITEQVYNILYQGRHPREAVMELLAREQKAEN